MTSARIRICPNIINIIDKSDKSWKLKMHLAVHRSRTVQQNLGGREKSKMPRVQLTMTESGMEKKIQAERA